jgi:hypothetical protein
MSSSHHRLALALLATSLIACGTGGPAVNDGSTDATVAQDAAQDGNASDTFSRADRVIAPEDSPSMPVDVMINPGQCGIAVHDCICNCRMDAMCQAQCVQLNPMCDSCVFDAQTECCPMQWMTLADCLNNSMCADNDEACLMRACGAQFAGFQNCVMMQANMPSCQARFRTCFGPDYPNIRCVMMQ